MKIRKAVITAAGANQRALPLQTLIDTDGREKALLAILLDEVRRAGIESSAVVVWPGDEARYAQALGGAARGVSFIPQPEPLGYAHAIYCASEFVAGEPFLHLVGDHLYITTGEKGCAKHVVETAEAEQCAVSAVQPIRETLLPRFGCVGGRRIAGRKELYRIETVIEKPNPTEAEQHLMVSGLRAGHYLGFFGMHALVPSVMAIIGEQLAAGQPSRPSLSHALGELARREKYLALEKHDRRHDLGVRYGLLNAQVDLALSGQDSQYVLTQLLDLLAMRSTGAGTK